MTDEYVLQHHGVLGMKWGVRRYQNYDGTRVKSAGNLAKVAKADKKATQKVAKAMYEEKLQELAKKYNYKKKYDDAEKEYEKGNYDKAEALELEADKLYEKIQKEARQAVEKQYPGHSTKAAGHNNVAAYATIGMGFAATVAASIATVKITKAAVNATGKAIESIMNGGYSSRQIADMADAAREALKNLRS